MVGSCCLLLLAFLGVIFYLHHNNMLFIKVIMPLDMPSSAAGVHALERKSIAFYIIEKTGSVILKKGKMMTNGNLKDEYEWIVRGWLECYYNVHQLNPVAALQSVLVGMRGTDLYISYTDNWLPASFSTYAKYCSVVGLLHTLFMYDAQLKTVFFLVDHKPMIDNHLSFSLPWDIGLVSEAFRFITEKPTNTLSTTVHTRTLAA